MLRGNVPLTLAHKKNARSPELLQVSSGVSAGNCVDGKKDRGFSHDSLQPASSRSSARRSLHKISFVESRGQ
jgi:hypothetical protein